MNNLFRCTFNLISFHLKIAFNKLLMQWEILKLKASTTTISISNKIHQLLRIGKFLNLRYPQFQSHLCYFFLFNSVWIILRSRLWNVKVFNHSYCNFKTITKFLISLNHLFFDPLIYIFIWHYIHFSLINIINVYHL